VAQDEKKLALAAMAMVSDEKHAWVLLRHHLDVDIVVVSFAGLSGASEATDDVDSILHFVNLAASLSPSVYDTDVINPFNRTAFLTTKGTVALDAQGKYTLHTRPDPTLSSATYLLCFQQESAVSL
jgi:hypothetical protein